MVGLWLTQAVQDGIEGFLIQQVPLRHSRVIITLPKTLTSGPEKGTKWQMRLRPSVISTGLLHPQTLGLRGLPQRGCRAASHIPTLSQPLPLPPPGRSGGIEPGPRSKAERHHVPGGLSSQAGSLCLR